MNISATTFIGDKVRNLQGENLGDIKEIMIDIYSGAVSYAVLDFGGFLGIGNKLFAVPWNALQIDTENKEVVLDMDKERLKSADGFDQDDWPNFADPEFESRVHQTYGTEPHGASRGRPS